jgi:F-type H+-transporting ATPase subunit delta
MSQVADRYALALFQLAQQHNMLSEVESDLREVKKVFEHTPELHGLIVSPRLSAEKRTNLITELFKGGNPYVINTVLLMIERGRLDEISGLVDGFVQLSNKAKGIEDAKVYSTRPLTEEELASISSAFSAKIGKQSLRIENIVDPSLLGGLRLQIGNRIFDSSVATKLSRLQRQLIG